MKKNFEDKLISILPVGEQNALHLEGLSIALDCTPADIKRQIKSARMKGAPILSSNKGYWLAESRKEIALFRSRMMRGAFSRLETIARFGSFFDKIDGQLEFKVGQNEAIANERGSEEIQEKGGGQQDEVS